jgi:hypothetical protein
MAIVFELPSEVADQLDASGDGEILEFRSGGEAVAAAFACLNVGATAITLLQGPGTFHYLAELLLGWRRRTDRTFTVEFSGPKGKGRIEIDGKTDTHALMAFLDSMAAD